MSNVRRTSIMVYNQILNNGLLSEKRMQVYQIIYDKGQLTGSQVAEIFKSKHPSSQHSESIRNRITELVKQGAVEIVGTAPCPITKNTVSLFETTDNLPVKIEKKMTKNQKVDEINKLVIELGAKIPEEFKEDLRDIYRKINKI